jgi:hypothetical protein
VGYPTIAEESARQSALCRCRDLLEDLRRQAATLERLLARPDADAGFAVAAIVQLQAACQGIDVAMLSVKARELRADHPRLFPPGRFPPEAP